MKSTKDSSKHCTKKNSISKFLNVKVFLTLHAACFSLYLKQLRGVHHHHPTPAISSTTNGMKLKLLPEIFLEKNVNWWCLYFGHVIHVYFTDQFTVILQTIFASVIQSWKIILSISVFCQGDLTGESFKLLSSLDLKVWHCTYSFFL